MRSLPLRFPCALSVAVLTLSLALSGQSGRTMTVDQPLQLGKVSLIQVHHPATAALNAYESDWGGDIDRFFGEYAY